MAPPTGSTRYRPGVEEETAIDPSSGLAAFQAVAGTVALAARLGAASAGLSYWLVLRPAFPRGDAHRLAAPLALWAAFSSLLLFASTLPEPWLQLAFLTGQTLREVLAEPSVVAQLVGETRFGQLWFFHQLASLALTSLMALVALRGGKSLALWATATGVGLLLPAFAALSGHTGTHGPLALINHLVHWTAATVWLGGLFHLLWMAAGPRVAGEPGAGGRAGRIAQRLVRSFSPVALVGLVAVVATGLINGWLYLPSASYLTRPGYGGWLLIKTVFVAGLIAVAAYNGLATAPKLQKGQLPLSELRFFLALEALIGTAVLVATQRLATQPPIYYAAVDHPGLDGRIALALAGPATAAGLLVVAAGSALASTGWRRVRRQRVAHRHGAGLLALGLGAALVAGGLAVGLSSVLIPRTPWSSHPNPIPLNGETLQLGRDMYQGHCTLCHGPGGKGDGLLAPSLSPPPSDLTRPPAAARTDGDLMWIITHGVKEADMPAFEFLTETQRWAIVHHLRSLQN